MPDTKTIWIAGAGVESVPLIAAAKQRGLHVVASDGDRHAPGFDQADEQVLVSCYDPKATVTAAQNYRRNVGPIDGVCSLGVDNALVVAEAAYALGLPGANNLVSVRLSADKLKLKEMLGYGGVPHPRGWSEEEVGGLVYSHRSLGLQSVVKPPDSRGARGVTILPYDPTPAQFEYAFRVAKAASPTGRVMIEQYLAGPQVSAEMVMLDSRRYAMPGFIDRNYSRLNQFAPHVIEDGGQQPSALHGPGVVLNLMFKAARALQVTRGIIKGDVVWTTEGPKLIELALRPSGGWMASHQIPLATGVDMLGIILKLALGEKISIKEIRPKHQTPVASRYAFAHPGRVMAISLYPAPSYLMHRHLFVREGDTIGPITSHIARAGVVICTGETRAEAVARAEQEAARIFIQTGVPVS